MKKGIIISVFGVVILTVFINASAQTGTRNFRKLSGLTNYCLQDERESGNHYYISLKPVTNREYLTYLCWLADVYRDYHEVFYEAIPGIKDSSDKVSSGWKIDVFNDFSKLVFTGREINKRYTFNLKYIDYPVIGLSWSQAMNYCGWLTDRYNEANLIWRKVLAYDPNQLNESSFNTEAYILDQYEGVVKKPFIDKETRKERTVQWSDHILFPAFRLPSEAEIESARSKIFSSIGPYKSDKFLDFWSNQFIKIKSDTLFLNLNFYDGKPVKIGPSTAFNVSDYFPNSEEHTLDEIFLDKSSGILDIYKNLKQNLIGIDSLSKAEKDKFGHMPGIIIGEDKNLNPLFVKRIYYKESSTKTADHGEKYRILRAAMNAVK
jgi:hypothetical protein